jgi:transcriptional regulator with XRE-family HTH domain
MGGPDRPYTHQGGHDHRPRASIGRPAMLIESARLPIAQDSGNDLPQQLGAARDTLQVGSSLARHRLGIELRRLREAHSLRLADVAEKLGVVPSSLSRIETGKSPARSSYVTVLLDIYGVDDSQRRTFLVDLARKGQHKNWWARHSDLLEDGADEYLSLEAAAVQIQTFAVLTIPDLLQTSDYAEAVARATRPELTMEQIRTLGSITRYRQEILDDSRCRLHAVIDESVLHRTMGSALIMAAQLEYLATTTASSSAVVQVAELAVPHPALSASFSLLRFADPAVRAVATRGDIGRLTVIKRGSYADVFGDKFASQTRAALDPAGSAQLVRVLATKHLSAARSMTERRHESLD